MSLKNISVSTKNALILIMTLVPFMIGMAVSVAKSSELDYFGAAINVSGSQRMRTMLIANYSQQLFYNETEDVSTLLEVELERYQKYMTALSDGDLELDLVENKYYDIVMELDGYENQYLAYVEAAEILLEDPANEVALTYIIDNALEIKNNVHVVVGMFEEQYLKELSVLKMIDYSIIGFSLLLTGFGLFLNLKIKVFEKYSTFDYLTGLKTRRMIEEDLKSRDLKSLSFVFLDLDKFKEINDTYGHDVGDEVLIETAKRLEQVFTPSSVYRYAGDEFVVVIPTSSREVVVDLVSNLKITLLEPFIDRNNNFHYIGFSAGCVVGDAVHGDILEILEVADDLMYDSKNYRSQLYIIDSFEELQMRKNMKLKIGRALENGEIIPYYQSIRSLEGEVIGYELLARWELDGEVYSPNMFIPLLRRLGMIEKFDLYMLSSSKKVIQSFIESDYAFSVNLSSEFISSTNFERNTRGLESIGLDRNRILLEVSENTVLDDRAIKNLRRLDELGYGLVIDDFTAGNTSLEALKMDFIKRVKLDMSVVKQLKFNIKWVEEIIQFLHSMGKHVLAEGVETESEKIMLKQLGIDYYQGYYFDKPKKNI